MKKYLLTIILFILIIPTIVIAGSCSPDDIEINTITLSKTMGTGEEVTAASIDNKSINLDVKLNNPNDYMEYTIKVRNNGTEDYYIKEEDFNNDQFLKYEFVHENNTFKIEPNEEKEITLRVSYIDRVEGNANYTSTDTLSLNIIDNQTVQVANTLKSVGITAVILVIIVLVSIFIGGGILINNKTKNLLLILIGIAILIPVYANASCDAKIDVDVKVELDSKNAVFDVGTEVNKKIKLLAGNTLDNSKPLNRSENKDENITSFMRSTVEPTSSNKEAKNTVSAQDSELPIYMWYESGTLYWWSEDDTPSLNADSSYFLVSLEKLTSIDTVSMFDTSHVTNLDFFFENDLKIANIDAVSSWNTSNVTTMNSIFSGLRKIENVNALINWNTSNVTNLDSLFCGVDLLADISGLANWDVSNVTNFECAFFYAPILTDFSVLENWDMKNAINLGWMFSQCLALNNIEFLRDWDISNVTSIEGIFYECEVLTNLDALADWDTSKVTNMCCAFGEMYSLVDATGIMYWDVSKVEDLSSSFEGSTALTTLDLSHWNTSSVKDISWMFNGMTSLVTLDISNFDTRNVTNFKQMFSGSNSLTTIYIGEEWNTSANTGETSKVFPTSCNLPNFSTSNTNYRYLSWAKPTTEGGYLTLKTND